MLERFIGLYAVDVGFVQTNIRRHGAMRRDLRRRSSGASRPTRRDAVDLRQQPHWVQSRPPTAPRSRFNSIASQLDTWLLPARIMPTSYQNLPVVGKAASLSCPSALLLDAYWLLSLQYEAVIAEAKSTLWSSALLTLVILLTCHSLTCSVSQSVSVSEVYIKVIQYTAVTVNAICRYPDISRVAYAHSTHSLDSIWRISNELCIRLGVKMALGVTHTMGNPCTNFKLVQLSIQDSYSRTAPVHPLILGERIRYVGLRSPYVIANPSICNIVAVLHPTS